jgi:hypothetical protein
MSTATLPPSTQTTGAVANAAPQENPLLVIERILRDREGVWKQVSSEDELNSLILSTLLSSTVALACYGAVLGASNGFLQALASAFKLPVLFLLTLAICLPTLYLFNLVFGSRLSVRQALAMVMVAITVTAMLCLAFTPISLFFLITAPDYDFIKLLNVAILTLTGLIGINFLINGMHTMNLIEADAFVPSLLPVPVALPNAPTEAGTPAQLPPPPPPPSVRKVNMSLLYIWIVLYGFVGTQLAWTLRPFFGDPGLPFQIFRRIEGNFYVNMFQTIFALFG